MKSLVYMLVFFVFALNSFKYNNVNHNHFESENLKIVKVTEKVYQHISYLKTKNYGLYPCNGMIYINNNEAIIFDTPVNKKASQELINWIGNKKIKAIIVTHFHIDCLGGLEVFNSKNIKSYATHKTIELAKPNHKVLPKYGFNKEMKFNIGNETVLTKFFGEGHTKDNIVGFIPKKKALFGGCLIKHNNAHKGNLADANTLEWSKTVMRLKKELAEIEYVIPGHGKSGGVELLDYTIQLFKNK